MDHFASGLIGIAIGFAVFLPSYLFADQSTSGGVSQVEMVYTIPIVLGMALMYLAPLIFWVIMPAADRLRS